MVRKNYRWREHAYEHKRVDLVSLRKFGMVNKVWNTVLKIKTNKKLWSAILCVKIGFAQEKIITTHIIEISKTIENSILFLIEWNVTKIHNYIGIFFIFFM